MASRLGGHAAAAVAVILCAFLRDAQGLLCVLCAVAAGAPRVQRLELGLWQFRCRLALLAPVVQRRPQRHRSIAAEALQRRALIEAGQSCFVHVGAVPVPCTIDWYTCTLTVLWGCECMEEMARAT